MTLQAQSPRFQGIGIFEGPKEKVLEAAAKFKKTGKGTSASCEYFEDSYGSKTVLTGTDAANFWKKLGVETATQVQWEWLHPIRSLKAIIREQTQIGQQMLSVMHNLGLDAFKEAIDHYIRQYPNTDADGKPVVRQQL